MLWFLSAWGRAWPCRQSLTMHWMSTQGIGRLQHNLHKVTIQSVWHCSHQQRVSKANPHNECINIYKAWEDSCITQPRPPYCQDGGKHDTNLWLATLQSHWLASHEKHSTQVAVWSHLASKSSWMHSGTLFWQLCTWRHQICSVDAQLSVRKTDLPPCH